MIHGKRIQALTRASVAVFIGVALGACGVSTDPAPTAQTPIIHGQPDAATSGPTLPEVVVSAPRPSAQRMAEDTGSRPSAKRRGG
ncbi:MAG TPA: hypothetical protein VKB72_01625 [Steroidobacteraceae bacterium]|nr:hypothetical protein [Steroidobacteraceae bacterium]